MPDFCPPEPKHFRQNLERGFTLVEMLTVMAIAGLLTTISITALTSASSVDFGNSVSLFADLIKEARATAKASNSYVWVGIAQSGITPSTLDVVALKGTTGLSTDLVNGFTQPMMKPLQLHNVLLSDALGGQAPDANPVSMASTSSLGPVSCSVGGVIQLFSEVIETAPTGQVYVTANTLPHWIQIGLVPAHKQSPKNFRVIYIGGLTGEVITYSP